LETINDQILLNKFFSKNHFEIRDHAHIASGLKYNFAPQVWYPNANGRFPPNPNMKTRSFDDESLHIVHFMGTYKNMAQTLLRVLPNSDVESKMIEGKKGYTNCNDGYKSTECMDVEDCATLSARQNRKFALVVTHDLRQPLRLPLPNMQKMLEQAALHKMDVVLIAPANGTFPLSEEDRKNLEAEKIKLVEVPWVVPPRAKYHSKSSNWCGPKDFIRVHAFGLTDYDAVAYYDNDIELQGDVTPALKCASRGFLLTTMGPLSPLNLGFFAVKPSAELLATTLEFAETADFYEDSNWEQSGWLPSHGKFAGADCGQGFLHTLFYKNTDAGKRAFEKTGLQLTSRQIDKCEWNYQGRCQSLNFECSSIRAHHKGGHGGCIKYNQGSELNLHAFLGEDEMA